MSAPSSRISDVRSSLARGRNSRSGALALLMGSPKIFNFRGERRQQSPNDASVIHCDLLAEREGPLVLLACLSMSRLSFRIIVYLARIFASASFHHSCALCAHS